MKDRVRLVLVGDRMLVAAGWEKAEGGWGKGAGSGGGALWVLMVACLAGDAGRR